MVDLPAALVRALRAHRARLLGHADVRLTLNTYTHHFAEGRRRVADAMEGLLAGDEDDEERGGQANEEEVG